MYSRNFNGGSEIITPVYFCHYHGLSFSKVIIHFYFFSYSICFISVPVQFYSSIVLLQIFVHCVFLRRWGKLMKTVKYKRYSNYMCKAYIPFPNEISYLTLKKIRTTILQIWSPTSLPAFFQAGSVKADSSKNRQLISEWHTSMKLFVELVNMNLTVLLVSFASLLLDLFQ